MLRPREIKWHCRYEDIPGENVYLFRKSLETLKNKDLIREELLIEKARRLFSKGGSVPLSRFNDPVLSYVLGVTSVPPSTETIVQHYIMDAQHYLSGTSFVDMCFILNEANVAHDFAKLHNIDFDILHFHETVVKNALLPMSDIYQMETTVSWLKVIERHSSHISLEKKRTSAERLVFVMRFLSGQKISAISEMAARGYYWDAFILMSILYPDHVLTFQFRAMIWKIYELDWLTEIMNIESTADMGALLHVGMPPLAIYHAIKDSLKNNIGNAVVMSHSLQNMRACLLAILCGNEFKTAKDAAEDLFKFVKSNSTLRAEFLPAADIELFEVAFVIMSHLVRAVIHISKSIANKTDEGSKGFITQLLDRLSGYKDILSNADARMGISTILYKFTVDVNSCSDICSRKPLYKEFAILALRIGEMMLKEEMNSQNAKGIYGLVVDSNIGKQIIHSLLLELQSLSEDMPLNEILVAPLRKLVLDVCDLLGLVMAPVIFPLPDNSDNCAVNLGPPSKTSSQSTLLCANSAVISSSTQDQETISKEVTTAATTNVLDTSVNGGYNYPGDCGEKYVTRDNIGPGGDGV